MRIDWAITDQYDPEIGADMADAAESDQGLPYVFMLTAARSAEARIRETGSDEVLTVDEWLYELRKLLRQWKTEGADNATL